MSTKTTKKRGLGRGLSDLGLNELLSRMTIEKQEAKEQQANQQNDNQLKQLKLDLLKPGKYQPRKDMNPQNLEELAESIRSQGIIQPIVVRMIGDNRFEIIAGERRWRAAKIAGLETVPAIIRDIPDNAAIAIGLIENIQRENLNAIDEAIALQRLSQEFSLTHQEIAKLVGRSRTTITNLLRLLNLAPDVKLMVERGELEMGHARALLTLDPDRQEQVAKVVVLRGMSVRDTELHIRRLINLSDMPVPKIKDPGIASIEKNLSKSLGARVTIKSKDEDKGKLIVHYKSREHLDKIMEQLKTMLD